MSFSVALNGRFPTKSFMSVISALLSDFRRRPSGRICTRIFRCIRPSGPSIEWRILREIRNSRKKFKMKTNSDTVRDSAMTDAAKIKD